MRRLDEKNGRWLPASRWRRNFQGRLPSSEDRNREPVLHRLDPERCGHRDRIGVRSCDCRIPFEEGDVVRAPAERHRRVGRRADGEHDGLGDRLAGYRLAQHSVGVVQNGLRDRSGRDEQCEVLGNARRVVVRCNLAREGNKVRRACADDEGRDRNR